MIRVLVINTVRFDANGISAVIKNYDQAMDKEGLMIDFLAMDEPDDGYRAYFENNHLNCHVLCKKRIVSYFWGIVRLCRRGQYDIVHVHGNSANMAVELLAAALGGVRVRIAHAHNTATMHPVMHRLLWPLFSRLCTVCLACGEAAGRWLYRDQAFTVLKNGIETQAYSFSEKSRQAVRRELGVRADEILLGHIGCFNGQKNHAFLIDVFSEVRKANPAFRLLLIGDGELMPAVRQKVHASGLEASVMLPGKTRRVAQYLQAMDLLLLPSLYEGLPLVLVEAQAAGLPCLVSDAVDREADLTDTCAFLPIDAAGPWAEAVAGKEYVACDRQAASEGNLARLREKGYDIGENAGELRRIYAEAYEHA